MIFQNFSKNSNHIVKEEIIHGTDTKYYRQIFIYIYIKIINKQTNKHQYVPTQIFQVSNNKLYLIDNIQIYDFNTLLTIF